MTRKINSRTTRPREAAALLIERHGRGADLVASNREDAAATEETACFYGRVREEIEIQQNHAASVQVDP